METKLEDQENGVVQGNAQTEKIQVSDHHRQSVHPKKSDYIQLFTAFFKIGAFTFGGGYAMIPLIHKEAVEKREWIDDEEMLDIIAVAESTPGPIAINAATFVGSKVGGIFGAIMATIGVVLPSFLIILCLASLIRKLQNYKMFQMAFLGVRAGILALIFNALVTMSKKCPKDKISLGLIALSFLMVAVFQVNTILVIALCGLIGIVVYELGYGKEKRG